jgi:hypothetical protein
VHLKEQNLYFINQQKTINLCITHFIINSHLTINPGSHSKRRGKIIIAKLSNNYLQPKIFPIQKEVIVLPNSRKTFMWDNLSNREIFCLFTSYLHAITKIKILSTIQLNQIILYKNRIKRYKIIRNLHKISKLLFKLNPKNP